MLVIKKLSEQLHDAYLTDNQEAITAIKAQLDRKKRPVERIVQTNTILNDNASSAIEIHDFLDKVFGEDWWEWETETIYHKLWIDYGVVLGDVNRDRVLAIKHLCRNDAAFFDWYEFNQIALSFSGCMADFDVLRAPSPGGVINCIKSMNHIRPDRNGEFGIDVEKYIAILMHNNGIYCPPPSVAQLIFDKLKAMVSKDTFDLWKAIIDRFTDFVNGDFSKDVDDDMVSIQAKRILKAELAGL